MNYSIKLVSEMTGLPQSTLRFYEKERLLPAIKRTPTGIRSYDDHDLEWISIITCLKNTDMPINDIKNFVALCAVGDETVEERREMILSHKKVVEQQMKQLQRYMDRINDKVAYYNKVCAAGTESIMKNKIS